MASWKPIQFHLSALISTSLLMCGLEFRFSRKKPKRSVIRIDRGARGLANPSQIGWSFNVRLWTTASDKGLTSMSFKSLSLSLSHTHTHTHARPRD